jgi:hypothetical protein
MHMTRADSAQLILVNGTGERGGYEHCFWYHLVPRRSSIGRPCDRGLCQEFQGHRDEGSVDIPDHIAASDRADSVFPPR